MGDWLITILSLVLLVAVADGVRRAIIRYRAAMRSSDDPGAVAQREVRELRGKGSLGPGRAVPSAVAETEDPVDPEEVAKRRQIAAELPGKVRVVQRRALEDALRVNREVQENFHSLRSPLAGSNPQRGEPQQAALDLDEQVPTLMDSIGADPQRLEPQFDETVDLQSLEVPAAEGEREPLVQEAPPEPSAQRQPRTAEPREQSELEEVLVINIAAPEGDCFEGNDLLRVLLSSGMRFGDMNIFHYHLGGDDGPVVFSLANMVVPGVFDLGLMEEFSTPGVSLFLALPIEGEAIRAFELMLSVAGEIATQLGGDLKDENRSVFTAQTAEHYRQRVMEYQRRKALARAQN
ncbi:cell division protein ZipA [Microbulbifer discodermiae]|uniref:cell division protein ZipA n=1 Tax=Microbulbifer sp. 2201CG32-9 TaxID=3232309 RepID=UPI00345B75D2